jgi:hypothetical protein
VTPAGRIVVTEYVAGAGLGALGLTPQQAWQDYRLALPSDGADAFTQAADVYQLGYLGLTLVSGKSIYDRQYPPPFATLLNGAEEIGTDGRTQPLHPSIVSWLTRACASADRSPPRSTRRRRSTKPSPAPASSPRRTSSPSSWPAPPARPRPNRPR